jgi:signal transduction histidine kinase
LQEDLIRLSRIVALFFIVLLAISSVFTILYGQYKIDVWTTAEGLPQNSVNAILQTRDGYMWLGTYGGLVRFDGILFTSISGTEGLPSNRILALCESRDGGLWIGTEGGGLSKYTNGTLVHYGKQEGLLDEVVYTLCEDRDTTLWIGTRKGVQCLRHGKISPHPFGDNILRIPVRSIYCNKTGVLWINSDHDVYRIENGVLAVAMTVNKKTKRVPSFLYEDDDGSLWFRGPHGLIHSVQGKIELVSRLGVSSEDLVTVMKRDSDKTYWIGSLNGGVRYLRVQSKIKFEPLPLTDGKQNSKIQIYFIDREGNRWVGTDGDGLMRIKNRMIDVVGAKEGLKHQIIEAVFEDSKNNIWVGTNDGGLYRLSHGSWHHFTEKEGYPQQSTWSLAEDKEGAIWAGSYGGGLYRYKNGRFKNFSVENGLTSNIVLSLYCDREGMLWIGTEDGGVNIYQHGIFRPLTEKDGLSNECILSFLADRTGAIWIGTRGGLNRYQNGIITVFTTHDGLSHNAVRSIYEDADSVLWIGTYGGGLNRLKKGKFTHYSISDGLYDNMVSAIIEDDKNNLWMSCNRGIFRVSRKQLNDFANGRITQITSIAYGVEQGLLSDETNGGFQPAAWKTKDGRLLFPTIKGLAVIPLARVKTNENIPPVKIEQILINQVEYPFTHRVEIPYDRLQQIEIHYSALNFTDPKHIQFKFRFEGVHGDWTDVKSRRVVYFSNLLSGEYTFHVIAANSDGVWNTEGASLVIAVRPPFWETWYFRIFIFCLVVLIFYAILWVRQRQQKRILEVQHTFAHQLMASTEAERKRIASELHDSLGQELMIIKNRALLALDDMKNKKNIKEQLDEISNTASQAIQEARGISYNLHPYQIDRLGLKKAIESIMNRAAQTATIAFTSDIDPIDNLVPKEMGIHVYRIVQECINNIIKHAKATTGRVTIKRWNDRLNIDIEDNGKGFDTSEEIIQSKHGFGLHGIAERARLLGGSMRIESNSGKGTRILLTIKICEETNSSN